MNLHRFPILFLMLLLTPVFGQASEHSSLEANLFGGLGGMFIPHGGSINSAIGAKVFYRGQYFLKPWIEFGNQTYDQEMPRGDAAISSSVSAHAGGAVEFWRIRLRGGIGFSHLRMNNAATGLASTEWDVSTLAGVAFRVWDAGSWELWSDFKLENIEFAGITAAYAGVSASFFLF